MNLAGNAFKSERVMDRNLSSSFLQFSRTERGLRTINGPFFPRAPDTYTRRPMVCKTKYRQVYLNSMSVSEKKNINRKGPHR